VSDGGDFESFEAWYTEQYPRLVTALGMVSGKREEAEEAAAEAFTRCLERWGTSDHPRNPSAWTYTVGLNLLKRRWKHRRREADHLASLAPPIAVEGDAPAIELWRAVAALPPRERAAVALRYVGGLSEKEVAEALGVTPGTVATALSRARKKLAVQLRHLGLGPSLEEDRSHG
jgi:RNA polymerase sigma-70 factor (ECF subfamily)